MLCVLMIQQSLEDLILALKIQVNPSPAHSGLLDNILERHGSVALFDKHPLGGFKNLQASALFGRPLVWETLGDPFQFQ